VAAARRGQRRRGVRGATRRDRDAPRRARRGGRALEGEAERVRVVVQAELVVVRAAEQDGRGVGDAHERVAEARGGHLPLRAHALPLPRATTRRCTHVERVHVLERPMRRVTAMQDNVPAERDAAVVGARRGRSTDRARLEEGTLPWLAPARFRLHANRAHGGYCGRRASGDLRAAAATWLRRHRHRRALRGMPRWSH